MAVILNFIHDVMFKVLIWNSTMFGNPVGDTKICFYSVEYDINLLFDLAQN